ncbi:Cadherin domain protein [Ignavibacterium album JCM 16511]|uniref:Cadherin domain protein n=1 Tax=Ignavibacterium album (strain DSM 19864 / JCM 16511 / NBRC 101810 / Mat9-16) TaxID=945713 RepID=I0AP18_IGNAJ|nr:T9SS type A sorting domain-containing protein [Ignavibacterium album]AFH50725.1 Cadherin domain protein [Ignavibacterium album JCM 16511]
MKKIFLSIVLFFTINIFSQNPLQPQISITITVTDGRNDIRNLKVGIDPLATDDIDEILGEGDLPPFPPLSVFEARFNLPINDFNGTRSSYWDFRNGTAPFTGTIEHRLVFQKGEGDSVVIYWNFPNSVTALLQDIVTGGFINIQMSGEGEFVVPNPDVFNKLKLFITYNGTTDIEDNGLTVNDFCLYQNYPNPFNPSTTIKYSIETTQFITLKIYDVLGNEIKTLVNETKQPGFFEINYTPEYELSGGIYYLELIGNKLNDSGDFSRKVKKMIYLK